ncbi:putative baseplate protein [Dickeya phage vB_DsoM_AD1]|uniref:Putative baseplate protein n=1 Tax=Dickeya phage vB_DsoM_AD1 TaxID=2283029 RepID=A0A384ZY59_9CAUD|nr:putative baseplate protein [Dickeya phage vB_DsoM_AD1]AXG67167.1 putative baseplate protein [Dickeya phage vB_DsoM_AD1]
MIPLNSVNSKKGIDPQMTYEAIVIDNNDPQKICQIRARIMGLTDDIPDESIPWIRPAVGHLEGLKGGSQGVVFGAQFVPTRGGKVSVKFPTGQLHEGIYSTDVRMTQADMLPEFQVNYPHRIGIRLSTGTQLIIDRMTNEHFLVTSGDFHMTIMGDVNQTIVGNQQLIVTGSKGDIPDYILNDPTMTPKSLKPDPKKRVKFKGTAKNDAGNQYTKITGNQTVEVGGNRIVRVKGDDTLDVKGAINIEAGQDVSVNGQTINLN